MFKIKLPFLKLDKINPKIVLAIIFPLIFIFALTLSLYLATLFKKTELRPTYQIPKSQTGNPNDIYRVIEDAIREAGTRKLYPEVQIYKTGERRYSGGRLIQMSTKEDPIFDIWASDYAGIIKIKIYKIDENTLIKYLTHDKDGKQINVRMDLSNYDVVSEFEVQAISRGTTSQTFPIEEAGIYFIRAEYSEDEVNDCVLVMSNISSVVKEGDREYIFWTQDIRSMRSVKEGSVTIYDLEDQRKSLGTYYIGSNGVSVARYKGEVDVAVVKSGGEIALVPIGLKYLNREYGGDYNYFPFDSPTAKYFTFVDRPIYKPGDTVYFKGIIRGDKDAVYDIPTGYVEVEIRRGSEDEPIFNRNIPLSSDGTVSGQVVLPKDAKTGYYYLTVSIPGVGTDDYYYYSYYGNTSFQVEYYRKPEYSIEVNSEQTEIVSGDKVKFTISGNYFSGQPLINQKVKYYVRISDSHEGDYYYNRDYLFDDDYRYGYYGYGYGSKDLIKDAEVTLNQFGMADVEIDFSEYGSVLKDSNSNKIITLSARFEDGSMNYSNSRKNVLIYNGDFSIFRESGTQNYNQENGFTLPIILTPHSNKNVSGIELTAKVTKETWVSYQQERYQYRSYNLEKEEHPSISKITNHEGKVTFSFPKLEEGAYRIVVEGTDERGNKISKGFYLGRYYYYSESKSNRSESAINLSIDKDNYFPSEDLILDIESQIPNRDVFITIERGHTRRYQVANVTDGKSTLKLKVLDTDLPNIYISASGFSKYGFNSKEIPVPISTDGKKLVINVIPVKEKYSPGDNVVLNVQTTDVKGNPVSANLAVWAIDKAIFEIAYNNIGNIFKRFWTERYNGTRTSHSLVSIGGVDAEKGGGGGGGEGGVRDTFEDTAYWNSNVNTDSSGRAQLTFKLPDNLTTWIISSIGSTIDTKVGDSREEIIVTKDIITRPFLPNILREGDDIVLTSLVHNFTDNDRYFDVSLAFDPGDITSNNYINSLVKSNLFEKFSWNVTPKKPVENAKLTFSAISEEDSDYSDIIVQEIPVREYGFMQKDCSVGENDNSYSVNFSQNINYEKSSLQISLSPGLIGTIPNSVKYLIDYPYGCIEQTVSRFVPLVIAKRNPLIFADVIKDKDIDDMIETGLKKLSEHQQSDGGWPWWYSGGSKPFLSAYVLEYILEAQKLGFDVDSEMLDDAKRYFVNLDKSSVYGGEKKVLSKEDLASRAYALALIGDREKFIEIADFEDMSSDILSLAVMANYLNGFIESANKGLEKLISMSIEHGSSIYWEGGDKNNFGSKNASTALAIRAIVTAKGDMNYAIKGARYLVKNRTNYYWSNTFATSQVIRAVVDYAKYSEELNPNYIYVVSLDGEEIGRGRVNTSNQIIKDIIIPSEKLVSMNPSIEISLEGKGQLYSTVCKNEFIIDRNLEPLNHGLEIEREYLDENGDKLDQIAVGDIVEVKLTINNMGNEELYGVIVDELPSGLIPMNTSLKNIIPNKASSRYYNYYPTDVDYTENGAVLSIYSIRNSTSHYYYKAQAVSEGTFYIPPATVSLMYEPEIFGRTGSEKITVGKESILSPDSKDKTPIVVYRSRDYTDGLPGFDPNRPYFEANRKYRENVRGFVSLVTFVYLLCMIYGMLFLIRKNITGVQIKDKFLHITRPLYTKLHKVIKKLKLPQNKPKE